MSCLFLTFLPFPTIHVSSVSAVFPLYHRDAELNVMLSIIIIDDDNVYPSNVSRWLKVTSHGNFLSR